jgi:RimJ/RimL family protein N-acetyltransferase
VVQNLSSEVREAWSRDPSEASSWKTDGDVDSTLPPLRIETPRLVLRCWTPEDAPLLKAAIDSSLEHLREWMPWAMKEPSELRVIEERIRRYQRRFLEGETFVYAIFDRSESEVVGESGLMGRIGPRALEIGYWIRANRAGRGFATEATRALTVAGLEMPGVDRLEIHCDPRNAASAAIPRKLGYRHRETVQEQKETPEGEVRETMIFESTTNDEIHTISR